MARPSDPKKLSLWQDRFQRFLISDLTVARFCAKEQVSVASFYHWRKRIGRQVGHKTHRQTVQKIGRPSSGEVGSAHHRHASPVFQPVTVVPSVCGVSVRLPGGTQIEIGAAHLDAIRAVVAETVWIDRSWAVCNPSAERDVSSDNQVTRKRGDSVPTRGGVASC